MTHKEKEYRIGDHIMMPILAHLKKEENSQEAQRLFNEAKKIVDDQYADSKELQRIAGLQSSTESIKRQGKEEDQAMDPLESFLWKICLIAVLITVSVVFIAVKLFIH